MPELPEVEITARLLDGALAGAQIESTLAPGINALRTFEPPLSELQGRSIERVRRRGKHLIVDASGGLSLLIHLMSAGRLQLYDRRAGPRDRTSRLLVRVRPAQHRAEAGAGADAPPAPGAELELRLREFGSKQAAWVKLLPTEELEHDGSLSGLGPEAWPEPPPLAELLDAPRPLHALLRDQHVIAGIGRSWVDEILWEARLSPYKRGGGPRCCRGRTAAGGDRRARSGGPSPTTSRRSACRSRTSCRCRCASTATRASRARAARAR